MNLRIGLFLMALSVCVNQVAAQCTGAGARLLFRETFGTVDLPVNIANRTNHRYMPICPNDGEYTITNRSDTMCYQAWHRVLNDHTSADGMGNMLIVNNSYSAGEFYRQTLLRLCSNSSYEFSAWYINLIKVHRCEGNNPILPNLTVRIETLTGRLVKEYLVGLLQEQPQPEWRRLSLTFTPPDVDKPVVVKLLNSEQGGCGNDFAFDDFELVQCRPCLFTDNKMLITSAFTPNGDFINDKLDMIVGGWVEQFLTTVYDRWGNVIFSSSAADSKWDGIYNGVPCQDGVYAWKVIYNYISLEPITHTQYGSVLLIR